MPGRQYPWTISAFLPWTLSKFLVLTFSLLQCTVPVTMKEAESRVVCYYTNWSAYRQGPAKFLPDNINPYLCTHLIYAFGGLTSADAGIKPFDKYQDIDKGGYTKFNGLKSYNKGLKTLLAIGGWNEGSGRFSRLVADAESRKSFIKNSIRFLRQYHFDGLDLDWEYPAAREGGEPEDKKNYAQFIKELREAFENESHSTGKTRLLLTIAVPAGIEWIQKGFDIPTINRNVDFFNLLTYDFHASTEPAANHHAPLKPKDGFSDYDYKSQLNIEYAINYYLDEGADAEKLVVGLPTYGRSYTLFNSESTDIGASASGPGTKGKYTKEPGYLAYYEICEGIKSGGWRVENDQSDTQGPHAVKDDQWVGYDDTRIMAIKAKWVREHKLGGIMFWSIDNDDFRGFCDGKAFPLIEAAKIAYYTGESPDVKKSSKNSNTRFSTLSRKTTTTTPTPPSTTTVSSTGKRKSGKKTTTPRSRRRRVKPKSTPTSRSTTTPSSVTSDPLRTPPPPTTPETSVDFECKDDGFFPHPKDCKKYFWCLDAPGLGIVAHHFTCPAGLYFNKNTDSCDYARNVPCKPGGTPTTTTKATTTTTTTPNPEEVEEDEYYDDDEEEASEEEEAEEEKPKAPKKKSGSKTSTAKSAQEIKDIRSLLKIIRKLGGVEELEKYLEANPDIADDVAEYEYEEEVETKPSTPKPATFSSARNRFSAPSTTKKVLPTTFRPYTSILRDRVPKTEEIEPPPSSTTQKSLFRPKYVTLSRERTTPGSLSSSTQTSVVVRFSNEEKFIEEFTTEKPVTYVTSRPYSKVTGSLENESEEGMSENKQKPKYVTLARAKPTAATSSTTSTTEAVSKVETPEISDDEYEEDYAEDDPEVSIPTSTTTTSTTTAKPLQRLRVPPRTRPVTTRRPITTTTSTTETPPPPKVTYRPTINFTPSSRRNVLFDRRRGSTTSTTLSPNQSGTSDESILETALITATNRTPTFGTRRQRPTSTTTSTPSPESGTRFRQTFRGSTTSGKDVSNKSFDNFRREENTLSTSTLVTLGPLSSAFQSAVIRRRTRKPTTPFTTTIPTSTSTTTTTTTTPKPIRLTTAAPSSQNNRIVPITDSQDYYYYVYEDEDDLLEKSQSQSVPSSTILRRSIEATPLISTFDPPNKITLNTIVPLSQKIQIKENGSIECQDQGIYAHPTSCGRRYVRCVENENGIGLTAWVYTCPKSLTFDPIGGMCNWATTQRDSSSSSSSSPCQKLINSELKIK